MNAPSPRLRDRVCVAGFCLVWLAPLAYHGLARARVPGEAALFHRSHDLAVLPDDRPRTRNSHHVEVRRAGSPVWRAYDEALDFGDLPSGPRSRLQRLLLQWGQGHASGRDEVARHIVAADRARGTGERPIVALRFVWAWSPAQPEGPPQAGSPRPSAGDFPPERRRVVSLHEFRPGGREEFSPASRPELPEDG